MPGFRKNSALPPGTRGCRKIFTADSFDLHICDETTPPALGNFPLSRRAQDKAAPDPAVNRGPRKKKKKSEGLVGSPAKYYCEGYTRLFHRLGSEEDLAFRMDSIFSSNLVYLTERQIGAVREFCSGQSDKYFLVGSLVYTYYMYPL